MWTLWRAIFVTAVDRLPLPFLKTHFLDSLHEKAKHGQEKYLRLLACECLGKLCPRLDGDSIVDPRRGILDLALGRHVYNALLSNYIVAPNLLGPFCMNLHSDGIVTCMPGPCFRVVPGFRLRGETYHVPTAMSIYGNNGPNPRFFSPPYIGEAYHVPTACSSRCRSPSGRW
jgi:hypothetical protein